MPYDDPEVDDPHMLVGVVLPVDERATREMAAAFADEFAQAGLRCGEILALFRNSFYAGAHGAWQLLGEDEIRRIVGESLDVWGRLKFVVEDHPDAGPQSAEPHLERALVGPNGFLKMLR